MVLIRKSNSVPDNASPSYPNVSQLLNTNGSITRESSVCVTSRPAFGVYHPLAEIALPCFVSRNAHPSAMHVPQTKLTRQSTYVFFRDTVHVPSPNRLYSEKKKLNTNDNSHRLGWALPKLPSFSSPQCQSLNSHVQWPIREALPA